MQEIAQAIATVCQNVFNAQIEPVLARPDEQFGDYATNVALQLGKQLGQNPREVAQRIVDDLKHPKVAHAEVAGPGFINLTLTDQTLVELALQQPAAALSGKHIIVEYSDPNPLKPLHAGHLYTTLVGDTIANLLVASGATVNRLNYGGDVGLHVGKSLWAILRQLGGEHPEKLQAVPEAERSVWLGARYVEGNTAYEEDEQAKAEIIDVNKRVYQLHAEQDKASAFAQIYWTVREWSYDYFKLLYQQLKVVPFDRFIPESEVAGLGVEIVREQLKRGVYEESDGAVVFRGDKFGLHTRVFINSEGLPTYEAKDVGLLHRKWEDYHFDESLVITANEQAQYYEVMLKSVEQFNPEPVSRSRHLTHGVVKLTGGVKMSSRKGNVVMALDILEAARTAGEASGMNPTEDTILAAVKYAFLRQRIGGDIMYDPAESVALEGNSGPYLQYAHARARSILSKAGNQAGSHDDALSFEAGERLLIRKLSEFTEVVDRAIAERMPHHICSYLYELAQKFNSFYEHNRVIDDPRQAVRLHLVATYADTLKRGLDLLNIPAPDRM